MIKYSVITPIYNEEGNIHHLLSEIHETMERMGDPWELICVDDGSTDAGFDLVKEVAALFDEVRFIRFRRNAGQSAALAAGFQAARGEFVITLDADLQNDPSDIPALCAYLDRYDMVTGWRVKRNDNLVRRFSSRFANGVRNLLLRETIKDTGCGLKIMKAAYLKRVKMYKGMHRFLPTLMKLEGGRVIEVAVSHRPRHAGVTKYGIWDRAFSGLRDLMAVRWMQDRAIHFEVCESNLSDE